MFSKKAENKRKEAISFYENDYKRGNHFRGNSYSEKRNNCKLEAQRKAVAAFPKLNVEENESYERYYFVPNNELVFLYFHAGGFTAGAKETGRLFLAPYLKKMSAEGISFDYPYAPENSIETILKTSFEFYKKIAQLSYKRFVLCGSSSGAMIVLSLIQYAKRENIRLPDAVVISSPIVILGEKDSNSCLKEHDIILRSYDSDKILKLSETPADKKDVFFDLLNGDYSSFPVTYISTGSEERLLDDSVKLFEKIKKENKSTRSCLSVYPGMWHGFLGEDLVESREEQKRVIAFLNKVLYES